jgi:hypothetical protein
VFGYDNTFFDAYDSYTKLDNKVVQPVLNIEFDRFVLPEIVQHSFEDSALIATPFPQEPRLSNYFYRPKLFLIKSSFLI